MKRARERERERSETRRMREANTCAGRGSLIQRGRRGRASRGREKSRARRGRSRSLDIELTGRNFQLIRQLESFLSFQAAIGVSETGLPDSIEKKES